MMKKIITLEVVDKAIEFLHSRGISPTTSNLVRHLKVSRPVVASLLKHWLEEQEESVCVKAKVVELPPPEELNLAIDAFINLFRAKFFHKYNYTYATGSVSMKQRQQVKRILAVLEKQHATPAEYLHWMFDVKALNWNVIIKIGFLAYNPNLLGFSLWLEHQKATVPDWAKEKHDKKAV